MYADDIVLLATDPLILQTMINRLAKYTSLWNLTVNLSKSKIMVFRNGGKLGREERWQLSGENRSGQFL